MSEVIRSVREVERLLEAGAIRPALKAAKSARKAHPSNAFLANLLGVAHTRAGDTRQALREFQQAIRLKPGFFEPHRNMAALLIRAGRLREALRILGPLAGTDAPAADTLRLLALAYLQTGDSGAAERTADRCLALRPDDADMLNLRGVARVGQHKYDAALEDYAAALALRPDMADTLANMAHPLAMGGRGEEALAALERSLALQPRHQNALQRYGVQLLHLGRREAARDAFFKLLEIAPHNADALRELSELVEDDRVPDLLERVAMAQRATRTGDPARAQLDFAEYRLRARKGDPKSNDVLDTANARARRHRPWNQVAAEQGAAAIIEGMPHLPPPVLSTQPADAQLIFILGLPRSGTTLTEQVLTAHPAAHGLGEFPAAETWMQMHNPLSPFDTPDAARLARFYRDALPSVDAGITHFTDKLPGNFRIIGHLLTAFPDAAIIHLRRDPLDVAWSLWRNWFSNPGLNFAFDQRAMANYFNMYARLMRHWRGVAGDRFHDLDYEDLVSDIEGSSRRLSAIANLPWVPGMVRPQDNAAPVRTASRSEVRAPVHTGSIGLGHRNADRIAGFVHDLDPNLWAGVLSQRRAAG